MVRRRLIDVQRKAGPGKPERIQSLLGLLAFHDDGVQIRCLEDFFFRHPAQPGVGRIRLCQRTALGMGLAHADNLVFIGQHPQGGHGVRGVRIHPGAVLYNPYSSHGDDLLNGK